MPVRVLLSSLAANVLRFFALRLDSGSLSKLDISRNQICGLDERGNGTYDASGLAALAKSVGNLKELHISSNCLKAEGAEILAPALQDSGSLASLDISNNSIGSEQEAKIKEICDGKSIKCTL
jgi:Ran GTPase-activating protein (RanGAP) involved in mRNA processing and transport